MSFFAKALTLFNTVLSTITFVFGAPTTCSRELGIGISGETDAVWMENIKHLSVQLGSSSSPEREGMDF